MEEKKFVQFKKDELGVKDFIKNSLGKGRISEVNLEYTPVGEKIIVATDKPGLVIGRRGEKIAELTEILKKRFALENPHIEIAEIRNPALDAQLMADEIAILLERQGSIKFKMIAYKELDKIMRAGALGAEIRLSGKLPSERAKSWRFAKGYLKKVGDTAKIVNRAKTIARTAAGVIGVKVSILPPNVKIHDQVVINEEMKTQMRLNIPIVEKVEKAEEKKIKKPRNEQVQTNRIGERGKKKTEEKEKEVGGKNKDNK